VQQTLFIDQIPLSGRWLFDANQNIKTQVDTIPILFSSKLLSTEGFLNALHFTRNGSVVSINDVQFEALNDTLYNIYGLRQAGKSPSNYQLAFNLTEFKKYNSGKEGEGVISISWTLESTNLPPVAKAGSDITVTTVGLVTLDGSASSDPESDQIIYNWVAPEGVALNDSTLAAPSFTITNTHQGNTYSFLLIVSDGSLFTTDVVDVIVNLETATYYQDADGDGYGNAAVATEGSTQPAGYVINNTDCDDTKASVHPGATEVCNGIDDNCDGLIDDGVQSIYYQDLDVDGYGNALVTIQAVLCQMGMLRITLIVMITMQVSMKDVDPSLQRLIF